MKYDLKFRLGFCEFFNLDNVLQGNILNLPKYKLFTSFVFLNLGVDPVCFGVQPL